jgi:hypothetical protein
MSLRGPRGAAGPGGVDDAVRRALANWSREHDRAIAALELRRAADRLSPAQRRALVERLAEISLGLLAVLDRNGPEPGAGESPGIARPPGSGDPTSSSA